MHPLSVQGGFGRFADALLAQELPALPDERRVEAVSFVCRRARAVPSPLLIGLATAAVGVDVATSRLGADRVVRFARRTRLPIVGELARMVRSLAYAFVWETWPDTAPDGRPSEARA